MMTDKQADGDLAGPRFCGEVSAAVSHEIKNVLAIIKETAGLLDDRAGRAQAEALPLAPDQVREATRAMDRQVRRADAIVRRLNRFAHSVDRESEAVELGESCRLLAELADRMLAGRGATLEVMTEARGVTVQTSHFRLLQFLWRGLSAVLAAAGNGARLQLTVAARPEKKSGGRLELRWQPTAPTPVVGPEFPGPVELELLAQLAWQFELNPDEQYFVLLLP